MPCVMCTESYRHERPLEGHLGQHGGTVVSTAASQLQGAGFDFWLGSLSVPSLHVLPVSAWVSSGCSGFLPQLERCAGQVYWPF